MIRTAHVIGSKTLGGAERFFLRLVDALRARGEPVQAFLRRGSEVVGQVPAGVPAIETPMRTVWDPWSRRALAAALRAAAPDVVQTYMGRATRLTRLRFGGRPVHVARLGGYYKLDGYRHAHAWVGNTRAIADYLVAQGLPADRVFHIGNFVPDARRYSDAERSERRLGLRLPDGAWVLFALGRLIEKKGFQDLLAALARLPGEIAGRPWVTLIAGSGEAGPRLAQQARELGLADRIRWLGWQDPADPWYDLADLVIVPSRHEPLGNVILEAWNHHRAVLSTASDGALELIRHGESGLLVPCAAPAALAQAVQAALASSDATRAALGEAGHRELQVRHGKAVVLSAYQALYDRLLRERLGGG